MAFGSRQHHWPLGQSTTDCIHPPVYGAARRGTSPSLTAALLLHFGFCLPYATRRNWPMKLTTIALASAFALSGTFAFAQAGNQDCGPNGCPGGPTSLSGTGPSTYGGSSAGAVGNNAPAPGGSMGGGTTGSAAGNQDCGPNGCPGGPTSLSGTGSSQFGGSTPGSGGKN
jgi:hypothetical protein